MGIKIGELAKKSGVAPSTIRYYVREGLLPEPEKVNKSMAYYEEGCVEKIKVIRELQESRYFPLSVIRNITRRMDEGFALEEAELIEDAVFGVSNRLIDRETFLKETGLSQDELYDAMACGLLIPFMHENDMYNQEDIRFAKDVIREYLDIGGELEDLEFYVRLGNEIMHEELELRKKIVHGKSKKENIKITAEISSIAEFTRSYILKRIFQKRVRDTISKSLD